MLHAKIPKKHKMKISIKDFFSKCDQIRSFLRIWSHLLKKSLIENFIFLLDFLTVKPQRKEKLSRIYNR